MDAPTLSSNGQRAPPTWVCPYFPFTDFVVLFSYLNLDYVDLSPFTDFVEYLIASHFTGVVKYFILFHSIVDHFDTT